MSRTSSFVVASLRLPIDISVDECGNQVVSSSPGGLVSALRPVLAQRDGVWVGWPGAIDHELAPMKLEGLSLHPVALSQTDFEQFYEGFSNATLWPLYHDLIVTPEFNEQWWETYRQVNERFAQAVVECAEPGATVWVQDYQLQLLPQLLKQARPDLTVGFFLHIPFPSVDLFQQLPWRRELLVGMDAADVIGFQLSSGADNYLQLRQNLLEPEELQRTPVVRDFPISIDYGSMAARAKQARESGAVEALRRRLGNPQAVLLGVDRLDYTKGISQRLQAFRQLLDQLPNHDPGSVVFVQVATPSRERIDHYRATRDSVEQLVGRINGECAAVGTPVVHYLHRSLPAEELAALYAAADVMVVTPLKDGMNLVSKEYVACHEDGSGALVLSEFAGAAAQLTQAHLCNPHDVPSITEAMLQALRGCGVVKDGDDAASDTQARISLMVDNVRTFDVHRWAQDFLELLEVK